MNFKNNKGSETFGISLQLLKKLLPRISLYLILGTFFGLLIYKVLSDYDPSPRGLGLVGRMQLVQFMLNLMPPVFWGWLTVILILTVGVWGDWRSHRFDDP